MLKMQDGIIVKQIFSQRKKIVLFPRVVPTYWQPQHVISVLQHHDLPEISMGCFKFSVYHVEWDRNVLILLKKSVDLLETFFGPQ